MDNTYIGKRTGLSQAKMLQAAKHCMAEETHCENCELDVTVNNIDCVYALMSDLTDMLIELLEPENER